MVFFAAFLQKKPGLPSSYKKKTLHVKKVYLTVYQNSDWKKFFSTIVEDAVDPGDSGSSFDDIEIDQCQSTIYSLDGKKIFIRQ